MNYYQAKSRSANKRKAILVVASQHLDVAWLWVWDPNGIDLMYRAFQCASEVMEKYSAKEFVFSSSTPLRFWAMEKKYPALFSKLQNYVKKGKLELCGGGWVEPDTAIPCGESLVRQILYGQKYFRDKFDTIAKVFWNPDVFPHTSTLPQILKKSGIEGYYSHRGLPRNNRLFVWEAPDGSRILGLGGKWVNDPEDEKGLQSALEDMDKYGINNAMIVAARRSDRRVTLEEEWVGMVKKLNDNPKLPQYKFSGVNDFVEKVKCEVDKLPVFKKELGEGFTGTFTTNGHIKYSNRKSEIMLMNAEKIGMLASFYGWSYPREDIELIWRDICLNQFHDIIWGTCVREAHEEAYALYDKINRKGSKVLIEVRNHLVNRINTEGTGKAIVVFNPLSWQRTDVVEVPIASTKATAVTNSTGEILPIQKTRLSTGEDGIVFIAKNVPAFGYEVYHLRHEKKPLQTDLVVSKNTLENKYMRVKIDLKTGNIVSLYDKLNNREVFAPGKQSNQLVGYRDDYQESGFPEGWWQAWNIKFTGEKFNLDNSAKVKILEEGSVRARAKVEKTIKSGNNVQRSTIVQYIDLYAGLDRIEFPTKVDWREDRIFLKVLFPFSIRAKNIACEVPYGACIREIDFDKINQPNKLSEGLQERFMQKWLDFSDDSYGVIFVNDCKYGYDAKADLLRLSLLRATRGPDMHPDTREHNFNYGIYPHKKNWQEGNAPKKGYEFNYPLIPVISEAHRGVLPTKKSFVKILPKNVIMTVLKRAEDSDEIIVRLFEAYGKDCEVKMSFWSSIKRAVETDLLERETKKLLANGNSTKVKIGHYEIKTVKITL